VEEVVHEEQSVGTVRTGQWSNIGTHTAVEKCPAEILHSALTSGTQHDPSRKLDLPRERTCGQAAFNKARCIDLGRIFTEDNAILVAVAADDDKLWRQRVLTESHQEIARRTWQMHRDNCVQAFQ
jgi:hypothetical protein